MEYQQIRTLLDRYFEGETTLADERLLREYFSGVEIDNRLREYAPLFQVLVQEKQRRLDGRKAEEMRPRPMASSTLRIRYRQWIARAAAVLLVVATLWWVYSPAPSEVQTAEVDWSKYEITDEAEALRITQGALFQVSRSLNDGAKAAAGQVDRIQEIGKFFK